MQNNQNPEDNKKQQSEQEANLEASENMSKNDDLQNRIFRERQNETIKSTDSTNDASALSNNHEHGQSNDSMSIEEKNKRRLENEEDADFGNEQLQ